MIEIYPVKVEAYQDGDPVFQLEVFDEFAATLRIDTMINEAMLPELYDAITAAVMTLKLKTGADE